MSQAEIIQTIITGVAGILVPIVILIVGNWYTKQKERTEANHRNVDRVALLLGHLSSDKTTERLLALQVLRHLRLKNEFPPELANTVAVIASRDQLDVAGAAILAMGDTDQIPDEVVLLELLAPMKVHFDRTRQAFMKWKPYDEATEQVLKQSNEYIRDLLISRAYLIPDDLQEDADELVKHYDVWLAEYQRVYKKGVRNPKIPYVFAGPKDSPFPTGAEQKFLDRYEKLRKP